MNDELTNIPSNQAPGNNQEKLLQYLDKSLSDAERAALEQEIKDDPFLQDALEGLAQAGSSTSLHQTVQDLNQSLRKQLQQQKNKRKKKRPANMSLLYMSIALILLLAVISYLVIKKMQ